MDNKAVVIFSILSRNKKHDLEIPLDITANDLVVALNQAYSLGIDTSDIKKAYLRSEAPIALLRGNKTLRDYGIMNGSTIIFTEQEDEKHI